MIYFYDNKVAQTLEIVKSAYDCADVLNDLTRIEQAIARVKSCGDWLTANQLDQELRKKHPSIDAMIHIASAVPSAAPRINKVHSNCDVVIDNLTQDYYGILYGTAIKKGLIHSAKEFIKSVD